MKISRRTIKAQTVGDLKDGTVFECMMEFGDGEVYMTLADGDLYLPHNEGNRYVANLKTGSVYLFENDVEVITRHSELIIDCVEG